MNKLDFKLYGDFNNFKNNKLEINLENLSEIHIIFESRSFLRNQIRILVNMIIEYCYSHIL